MADAAEYVIRAENVSKFYQRHEVLAQASGKPRFRKAVVKSVDGVSLTLRKGEVVGILGESGCGKSTLGRVLAGLEPPTSGTVELNGETMKAIYKRSRKELRCKAQMIFQNPFDTFDPRHKIERVLVGALTLHGIGSSKEERRDMACKALENAGLRPGVDFLKRYPGELSGGQLQRISIIRSMMLSPEFIVADEPVSMLDVSIRADIINTLSRLARQDKTSVVFISHDIATIRYIADRIAVMYLGQIVETGTVEEVLSSPKHPYTKALVSNCPSVDPRVEFSPIKLEGDPPSPTSLPSGCYFSPRCVYACPACYENMQPLRGPFGNDCYVRCGRTEL